MKENEKERQERIVREVNILIGEICTAVIANNQISEYMDYAQAFMHGVKARNPDFVNVILYHRLCGSNGVEDIVKRLDFDRTEDSIELFVRATHYKYTRKV